MTGDTPKKGPDKGIALETTGLLTGSQLEQLKSQWICTLEQFVAAAATDSRNEILPKMLNLQAEDYANLLDQARGLLGDARYQELMDAKPGGQLGAILDEPDSNPSKPDSEDSRE